MGVDTWGFEIISSKHSVGKCIMREREREGGGAYSPERGDGKRRKVPAAADDIKDGKEQRAGREATAAGTNGTLSSDACRNRC